MLKTLSIQNLATIESIAINLERGFNVLTGETGAGKSIIIGGLELALGGRASSDDIRADENIAVVEASFAPPFPDAVISSLKEIQIELGDEDELTIRREIIRSGKNRCFINNQMAGVADLKHLGEMLVDLHGQHEHQSLFHTSAHRTALDAFAGHEKLLDKYRAIWSKAAALRRRRNEFEESSRDFEKRLDFLNYQIAEIEKINPLPGELASLENEEKRLAHAETLARLAAESYSFLYEGADYEQPSIISLLHEVAHRVGEICAVESNLANLPPTLEEIRVQLEDMAYTLRDYAGKIQADPQRLDDVTHRLETIRRLIRKHGGSEESLFQEWETISAQLNKMNFDETERRKIEEKLADELKNLSEAAERLRQSRLKAADKMRKEIQTLLRNLAMEKAQFDIQISPMETPDSNGQDAVEFLLAANPGLGAAPLRKVASGGELSRVMLAIKSVMAGRDAIPTLVFDEIDAGISGEVSRHVGKMMETLSESHQILCITHHAAIAARAGHHIAVRKALRRGKTFTELCALEGEERLKELANMMGGKDIQAALLLARQLMQ